MNKNIFWSCLTLILLVRAPVGRAGWPFWGMRRHATRLSVLLKNELNRVESGLLLDQDTSESNKKIFVSPQREAFYLSRLRVRVRPYMQFQLPGIVKLKVFPILEMHFTRKIPRGWKDYKPATP